MDDLQYLEVAIQNGFISLSFKPCYKWMTFNTQAIKNVIDSLNIDGFKPCYKWMTFNTYSCRWCLSIYQYGFKPCYKWMTFNTIQTLGVFVGISSEVF